MKVGKDSTCSRKGAEEGARAFAALVLRRHHRAFLWVAGAVGLLSAASAGFLVWEVRAVQSNLAAAQVAADRLQTEMARHRQPSAEVLGDIRKHTAAARGAAGTPVWSVAENLPLMGPPLRSARGLSVAADEIATGVLPDAVRLHQMLASGPMVHHGRVDLRRLSAATDLLGNARRQLTGIETSLNGLPGSTVVGRLDMERQRLSDRVARLSASVSEAEATTRLLMPLLGASEPRSYFLALQNNAEARGTGGLVGTFGILTADRGRITLHDFASDDTLPRTTTPVANFGPEFDRRYGAAESTQGLANSNLSAHFPYAAQIWVGLWERHTGQRLDGAIATDPVGLARVLKATGPVRLPDGKQLTAENTVELTEHPLRVVQQHRTKAFPGTGRTVSRHCLAAPRPRFGGPPQRTATERRRRPTACLEQRCLHQVGTRKGGAGRRRPRENRAVRLSRGQQFRGQQNGLLSATVADLRAWSLRGRYPFQRGAHQADKRRSHHGLASPRCSPFRRSPALTSSGIHKRLAFAVRQFRCAVHRWDPGRAATSLSSTEERGHPVLGTQMELLPGQTREVDIRLLEPASDRPPVVPLQPLARPQTTKVHIQPCVK